MPRLKLKTPNFNMTRRADGYYQIRHRHDGRTKTVSTGTRDAEKAELFRAQYAADYLKPKRSGKKSKDWYEDQSTVDAAGTALPDITDPSCSLKYFRGPTLNQIINAYIRYRKPIVASPKTLEYVFDAPRRLLGAIRAEAFRQSDVARYIKLRSPEASGGRFKGTPVSEGTISKELRMIRAALNWGYAELILSRKPEFRIELLSSIVRDEWITKDEANRLIAASSPHLALFILIALSTAKRRSAILQLTWDGVSLDRPGHEGIDFCEDVGNKRRGYTPIAGNVRLIQALKEANEKAETKYVIEWRGARVLDVKTGMNAAVKRAGIRHVSSHMLKHTAITWMVQADVSFERIAKYTNTSKDVIERVYGHHSPEFVSEAIKALEF